MIDYKIYMNNGNEILGIDEKTITVNESLKTCEEDALAREINHLNPLIPVQVANAVLENFCAAAAHLMDMGFAVQLRSGKNVALRLYPNVRIKDGSINLARARQLDPQVTALTEDNAGDLVSKAGVTVRVKAEALSSFSDILKEDKPSLTRVGFVDRPRVVVGSGGGTSGGGTGGSTGGGGTSGGGTGDDEGGGGF